MQASDLISDSYRAQQEHLHQTTNYGVASIGYAPLVAEIINKLEIAHVLDYGAGAQLNLLKSLNGKVTHQLKYQAYDAGVERLSKMPIPADMVCCIDVLEHIEPDLLDNVLDHLAELTEACLFATVHTGPAVKTLTDGRNAHLTQEPMEWWLPKFWQRFDIQTVQRTSDHAFHVIAYSKPRLEATDGTKI